MGRLILAAPILSEHANETIEEDLEIIYSFYIFPHNIPGMCIKTKKILDKILVMENLAIHQLTSKIEEIYIMNFYTVI